MPATTPPAGTDLSYIAEDLHPLVVPISSLVHMPGNPRRHDDRNLRAIRNSVGEFRQVKPLVVGADGRTVVAGNGTLQAMRDAGYEWAAVVRTDLTGPRARAFALADNRATDLSTWDRDLVGEALSELDQSLRACAGFDPLEAMDFLGTSPATPAAGAAPQPTPGPSAPHAQHFDGVAASAGEQADAGPAAQGYTPAAAPTEGQYNTLILTGPTADVDALRAKLNQLRERLGVQSLFEAASRATDAMIEYMGRAPTEG